MKYVPSIRVAVMKIFHKPGGQRRFKGHVVSINQYITTLATDLPLRPLTTEIPILIIQPRNGGTWSGRQLLISVERVPPALAYLVANSPTYAGVRSMSAAPPNCGSDRTQRLREKWMPWTCLTLSTTRRGVRWTATATGRTAVAVLQQLAASRYETTRGLARHRVRWRRRLHKSTAVVVEALGTLRTPQPSGSALQVN